MSRRYLCKTSYTKGYDIKTMKRIQYRECERSSDLSKHFAPTEAFCAKDHGDDYVACILLCTHCHNPRPRYLLRTRDRCDS
ncbi:hypothetical protein ACHAXS_002158 [Conticribra weissflogii]